MLRVYISCLLQLYQLHLFLFVFLFDSQTGLTDAELKSLDEIFRDVYKAKYPIVGHVSFNIVPDNAVPLHRDDDEL